ncbi:C39 family peptidase [Loigolactobacillus jiayinensis]|uniref:C39 family peptidase n=1 Tax=Loigolactobacillus jiayinensis TaxID=2486016 RepID=A0ABW1RDJ8_9LACO
MSQYASGAPMGCEAAALLEGLQTKGYATNLSLKQLLKQMPLATDGNPNYGFGGTPYKIINGTYQSIYAAQLAKWARSYDSKVADISGTNTDGLKNELRNGNPIVVYVTYKYTAPVWRNYNFGHAIDNAHVVLLDGYRNGSYHIVDPAGNQDGLASSYWISATDFENSWNARRSAVAIR